MMAPMPGVLAIGRPLRRTLLAKPFSGYVVSRFPRACNLMDTEGRVITLALPSVGNGPFFVVLDAAEGLFKKLQPHQPIYIDSEQITLGPWCMSLRTAHVWDSTLPTCGPAFCLSRAIAGILQPYTDWPQSSVSDTPVTRSTARLLAQGARALMGAVERKTGIAEAVQQLAGLGSGLTPAGDDCVLGVMAALWLLGQPELLPAMAQAIATRTTTLSGAFLTAAAEGQFIEAWHGLAHALNCQDEPRTRRGLRRLAALGASSGRDTLAGFATILLNHARCH